MFVATQTNKSIEMMNEKSQRNDHSLRLTGVWIEYLSQTENSQLWKWKWYGMKWIYCSLIKLAQFLSSKNVGQFSFPTYMSSCWVAFCINIFHFCLHFFWTFCWGTCSAPFRMCIIWVPAFVRFFRSFYSFFLSRSLSFPTWTPLN